MRWTYDVNIAGQVVLDGRAHLLCKHEARLWGDVANFFHECFVSTASREGGRPYSRFAKVEVASSNLVSRSIKTTKKGRSRKTGLFLGPAARRLASAIRPGWSAPAIPAG